MTITVYGASLSPFVRKVCIALQEKQIPYDQVQVDPSRLPEDYHELSPFGRIPALRDGDDVLADSGVIMGYLEHKYPQTPLTPNDPYLKAKAAWFEKFADYELAPFTTFGVFRNRVLMKMMGMPSDDAYVEKSITKKLPPLFDYLEANIQGNEFIVGASVSVADIAIASQFVNFSHGKESIDASRWPNAAAYITRLHERPIIAAMIAQESAFIEKILSRR
jgi:glutathione S-transferase